MKSSVKSIKACAAYYGPDADAVEEYLLDYNLEDLSI